MHEEATGDLAWRRQGTFCLPGYLRPGKEMMGLAVKRGEAVLGIRRESGQCCSRERGSERTDKTQPRWPGLNVCDEEALSEGESRVQVSTDGCGEGERQTHLRVWMCPNQDLSMDWMCPGEGEIKSNSLFLTRASERREEGHGLRWGWQRPRAPFEESRKRSDLRFGRVQLSRI